MKKKNVWVMSFTHLNRDPRVKKQIQWLAPHYNVTTFGLSPSNITNVRHIQINSNLNLSNSSSVWIKKAYSAIQLLLKSYEQYYWENPLHKNVLLAKKTLVEEPCLIVANDIESLPLAVKMSQNAKILVDLHEYAPREWEEDFKWRVFKQDYIKYLCARYLPNASAVLTVAEGIADEYLRCYGIRPIVLSNASHYADLSPMTSEIGKIKMIHHGIAIPSRRIEVMIEMMRYLDDRFTLDLVLVPSDVDYLKKLKDLACKNSNVRFLPPVPMDEIVKFSNKYDIGLYLLPPANFNSLYALPNKFFEFIQSRLALAIGPSPEMSRLVNHYGCGVISEDFNPKSMAQRLLEITPEKLASYKLCSHHAAKVLNSDVNCKIFLNAVNDLLQ